MKVSNYYIHERNFRSLLRSIVRLFLGVAKYIESFQRSVISDNLNVVGINDVPARQNSGKY